MPLTLYKTFAWQTFTSLCLFTCLVYVNTYCVPIALLPQNQPFRLLFPGYAQIIILSSSKKVSYLVGYLKEVTSRYLRAYCTFASKPAVSITLSGLRPNNYSFFLEKSQLFGRLSQRSDLEISRINSALTLSNRRIKPKTYRLCVPNLVPKKAIWDITERRECFTSRSAKVIRRYGAYTSASWSWI